MDDARVASMPEGAIGIEKERKLVDARDCLLDLRDSCMVWARLTQAYVDKVLPVLESVMAASGVAMDTTLDKVLFPTGKRPRDGMETSRIQMSGKKAVHE